MRQMVYRIMTVNGDFPYRSSGRLYKEIIQDKEYAKRCEKAIRQFNKGVKMIIEESELQWQLSGS
jgi:hypothetical protein